MDPFITHTGVVAPLGRADVDTDQIVPKQFLKRVERSGYGRFLFYDWRYSDGGEPRQNFVLNQPGMDVASVLVAGRNFACGSSREHAAWALQDYGFRAVVAPSFSDIFRENADQNGIVTVELPEEVVAELLRRAETKRLYQVTVDLEACCVTDNEGFHAAFHMDAFRRACLLEGLDRIGLTLRHEEQISAFEVSRRGP